MYKFDLMYAADFYKVSHKEQYPKGTENVYSVLTARSTRLSPHTENGKVVFFGFKYFHNKLLEFSREFFNNDGSIISDYKKFLDQSLGGDNDVSHWHDLHRLGYLPIEIRTVKEGEQYDVQTPLLTVENTVPEFFWLTNFIETTLSANIWLPCTSATIAHELHSLISSYFSNPTEEEKFLISILCHDFSYRGMAGDEASILSGIGHLHFFNGSDSMLAIREHRKLYGGCKGISVPATEHSVMCAGSQHGELDTFNRLLDIYPTGIVSIVSDTWDYYNVLENILPKLKTKILKRNGKLVIRPDSGNPEGILLGGTYDGVEYKSSINILKNIFGTSGKDSEGRDLLNEKIGLIYGDSMTIPRIKSILNKTTSMGFSPLNIVFGIGSYTYQYNTRDTLGFAFKATSVRINGVEKDIVKTPKTDMGKKSLTGRFYDHKFKLSEVYRYDK